MNKKHIPFWSEVADMYEEFADNPPKRAYTCDLILEDTESEQGWDSDVFLDLPLALRYIWTEEYGDTSWPIGSRREVFTASKRSKLLFDFCWFMADTIREAIGED
jgi:hypothetical protein